MTFPKGVSGNPGGKPRTPKPFREMVDRAIYQDNGKRLRAAAESLLDLAAQGEQWAVCALADRLDGKPAQMVELSGAVATGRASELSDDDLALLAAGVGKKNASDEIKT